MEIITKAEAKARGLKKYFTGKPCQKGHVSDRNVSTGQCRQCMREYHLNKTRGGVPITRVHCVESAKLIAPPELHSKIIMREEAKEQGLVRYFTGVPCKRGHISERKVSTGDCLACGRAVHLERSKTDSEYVQKNRENSRRQRRERKPWYVKACATANHHRMIMRNATHASRTIKKAQTEWWENPDQALIDREKKNEWAVLRRRRIEQSTPHWVNKKHIHKLIQHARVLTEQTGIEHEVDHYYPVSGATVCGLTVPWNLQVITQQENRAKSKKMPEEFYGVGHEPPNHFLPVVETSC